jgi:hypothetical protein
LARCALDLQHPKFRHADDVALQVGLDKLRDIIARDHKLSGWFCHPMPRYPQYQNKIWKWDFKPEGDRSATRKGWRLYAYVDDPAAIEPIPATAFLCYDKADTPKGDHVKYLYQVLKEFLAEIVEVKVEEERFRRITNSDGEIVSLCYACCETVAIAADIAEVELAEGTHHCSISEMVASSE